MSDPIYWDDEIKALGREFWENALRIFPENADYIKKVLAEFDMHDAVQDFKSAIGDATGD
jgi:hypothetical protein